MYEQCWLIQSYNGSGLEFQSKRPMVRFAFEPDNQRTRWLRLSPLFHPRLLTATRRISCQTARPTRHTNPAIPQTMAQHLHTVHWLKGFHGSSLCADSNSSISSGGVVRDRDWDGSLWQSSRRTSKHVLYIKCWVILKMCSEQGKTLQAVLLNSFALPYSITYA